MSEWTEQEIKDVLDEINKKACTEKDFRKLVLNDPAEAIKQVSGKEVPAGLKIKVIENESGIDHTHVLPDFVSDEISNDELENVAGGHSRGVGTRGPCIMQILR